MSNMTYILTSVLLSFLACAIFMSLYMEDMKESIKEFSFGINSNRKKLRTHDEELNILRARVYDLENKVNEITKEMEKLDDGK